MVDRQMGQQNWQLSELKRQQLVQLRMVEKLGGHSAIELVVYMARQLQMGRTHAHQLILMVASTQQVNEEIQEPMEEKPRMVE
jgi:hypothetical protein